MAEIMIRNADRDEWGWELYLVYARNGKYMEYTTRLNWWAASGTYRTIYVTHTIDGVTVSGSAAARGEGGFKTGSITLETIRIKAHGASDGSTVLPASYNCDQGYTGSYGAPVTPGGAPQVSVFNGTGWQEADTVEVYDGAWKELDGMSVYDEEWKEA